MNIRTGIGYDIHRFADGRDLILGSVRVPYRQGLDGHSDADVLVHAVCDALLGAIGAGDIGEHFPNTDTAYKDISSLELLKKVKGLIDKEGYTIQNVDTVLQMEEPHLKEYKQVMCEKMAETLGLAAETVNVKATTQEKIGAIGRGDGIAAFATVLLIKK